MWMPVFAGMTMGRHGISMQYTTLGRTGLRVSVAGLGTGGFSRLGLQDRQDRGRGGAAHPRGGRARHQLHRHRAGLRHRRRGGPGAQDAPARSGRGRHQGRSSAAAASGSRPRAWSRASTIRCALMGTDYVDVFNLHGVEPQRVRSRAQRAGARADRTEGARARSATSASPRTRSSISPTRRSSARAATTSGRCSWWASTCCTRARGGTCFR